MKRRLGLIAMLAAGTLTACGGSRDETVGGITVDEATQLNNAAEMLDASPDDLAVPADVPLDAQSNSGDAAGGGNIN